MTLDIWKSLAGLGAFLFGMLQLEDALKQLAGRTFKLFLKRHTKNRVKAILSGALVTGVLQSSSVVTLIVLGFVGAGILNMRNAFAVVMGSNLGTTFDSWIVATLGFKFDAEKLAFPLITLSGIGFIFFQKRIKIQLVAKLLMGCGLLFLGLEYMKEGVETLAKVFDLKQYSDLNNISFVLIGLVVTAIIQSSSATMVIVLSALHTGTIPFTAAAAIVIGAELGSSIKIILGAIGNVPEKKKVAYANVLFNVCITSLGFILLIPLVKLIRELMGVHDPLIALVVFQSLINLGGIILFFPFLNWLADLMDKIFKRKGNTAVHYIYQGQTQEAFIETMEKETFLFLHRVLELNATAFEFHMQETGKDAAMIKIVEEENKSFPLYAARYKQIKQAEGEILLAYTRVAEEKMDEEEFLRLNQLISTVRSAMYAAKGIKDLQQDREDLKNSANDAMYAAYNDMKSELQQFYHGIAAFLHKDQGVSPGELSDAMDQLRRYYEENMNRIHEKPGNEGVSETDVSTLLNMNREFYSSGKSMIHALKHYLLDARGLEDFENAHGIGF